MSAAEQFTPEERALLSRFVTNVDGPVFALVNLPEVVKGALFARYSRSPKDLRRLFLDEFVRELDIDAPVAEYWPAFAQHGYCARSAADPEFDRAFYVDYVRYTMTP